MKQIAILILLVGASVFTLIYGGNVQIPRGQLMQSELVLDEQPIQISMISSDEKSEWIRMVASEFARHRPDIQINLEVMGSMDSLHAISAGERMPTVWSPADFDEVFYLGYLWNKEHGVPLFTEEGVNAPRSVARSPIVWLSWESRVQALQAARKSGAVERGQEWAIFGCAGVSVNQDGSTTIVESRWSGLQKLLKVDAWDRISNLSEWGAVQLLYADPRHSNAGLQTLYLMAHPFLKTERRGGRRSSLDRAIEGRLRGRAFRAFRNWFRQCHGDKEEFPPSSRNVVHGFKQFGLSKADFFVTYENLAITLAVDSGTDWEEQPQIYYPSVTSMSEHPVVILQSDRLASTQLEAARDWIAFLLAPESQRQLIGFGLRPARDDISVVGMRGDDNPFREAARYHARLELKGDDIEFIEAPSGMLVDFLLKQWQQATGRY